MTTRQTNSPSEGHPGPIVAIDWREQLPYPFEGAVVKQLPTGDYSLVGFEDRVTIERKTKKDAYSSLGRDRERFEHELERLAVFEYPAIVIEASLRDFLRAPEFTQMSPRSAINSLLAWSVRFRVLVFFAGDRTHGHAVTKCLLEKFWRYRGRGSPTRILDPTLGNADMGRRGHAIAPGR